MPHWKRIIAFTSNLISFTGRYLYWLLCDIRGLSLRIIFFLVVVTMALFSFAPQCSSDWLKIIATASELAGLTIVLLGVRDRQVVFSATSLAQIVDWVRDRPKFSPTTTTVTAALNVRFDIDNLRAHATLGFAPGATVEDKLNALHSNYNQLSASLFALDDKVNRNRKTSSDEIDNLRNQLGDEVGEVQDQLRQVATGNLAIEYVGAICIIVGLLLANFHSEITEVFGWKSCISDFKRSVDR